MAIKLLWVGNQCSSDLSKGRLHWKLSQHWTSLGKWEAMVKTKHYWLPFHQSTSRRSGKLEGSLENEENLSNSEMTESVFGDPGGPRWKPEAKQQNQTMPPPPWGAEWSWTDLFHRSNFPQKSSRLSQSPWTSKQHLNPNDRVTATDSTFYFYLELWMQE